MTEADDIEATARRCEEQAKALEQELAGRSLGVNEELLRRRDRLVEIVPALERHVARLEAEASERRAERVAETPVNPSPPKYGLLVLTALLWPVTLGAFAFALQLPMWKPDSLVAALTIIGLVFAVFWRRRQ